MIGDTNRDLIQQLHFALARVIQNNALKGYHKQLDMLDIKITDQELKSFEYLTEEYDLGQVDRMLCNILQTDYMAPV